MASWCHISFLKKTKSTYCADNNLQCTCPIQQNVLTLVHGMFIRELHCSCMQLTVSVATVGYYFHILTVVVSVPYTTERLQINACVSLTPRPFEKSDFLNGPRNEAILTHKTT